jgi:cysteine-rich repeat protein
LCHSGSIDDDVGTLRQRLLEILHQSGVHISAHRLLTGDFTALRAALDGEGVCHVRTHTRNILEIRTPIMPLTKTMNLFCFGLAAIGLVACQCDDDGMPVEDAGADTAVVAADGGKSAETPPTDGDHKADGGRGTDCSVEEPPADGGAAEVDGDTDAGDKVDDGKPCGAAGAESCASGVCNSTGGMPGTCATADTCGNGKVESGEVCDDGNTEADDGCDPGCKREFLDFCGTRSDDDVRGCSTSGRPAGASGLIAVASAMLMGLIARKRRG